MKEWNKNLQFLEGRFFYKALEIIWADQNKRGEAAKQVLQIFYFRFMCFIFLFRIYVLQVYDGGMVM